MPGYIDAFFGPPEWKVEATQAGQRPIAELQREAASLANAIQTESGPDLQQQDFMEKQVQAMEASLRLLSGERLPLAEEVAALYDITPTWVEERFFEEAHRSWADSCHPANRCGRMIARKQALEVPVEQVAEVLPILCDDLRQQTKSRFPYPPRDLNCTVSGQPERLSLVPGDGHSRIDVNTDLPLG
jgi:hypothetical protein